MTEADAAAGQRGGIAGAGHRPRARHPRAARGARAAPGGVRLGRGRDDAARARDRAGRGGGPPPRAPRSRRRLRRGMELDDSRRRPTPPTCSRSSRSTSRRSTSAPTARAARLVEAMRYSLLAGGKRIRPVLTLATARSLGADPAAVLPDGRRPRAHPHLLADPRRPAGDRRRHAAPRPADLPRGLRRGHRHPRRRRAVRRGVPRAARAPGRKPPRRARRGCAEIAARHRRPGHGRRPVHGRGGRRRGRRRPAHPARAQDRAPHRGGRRLRRRAQRRRATRRPTAPSPRELGLLFQIVDDILDESGDEAELGKSVGKDRAQDKVTYVSRFGIGRRRPPRREAAQRARASASRRCRATPSALAALTAYIRAAGGADGRPTVRPPGPVLYSRDDAVPGQDLRPRRPPAVLRARADAARRRDPRGHPLLRERGRRPSRREPRHGRAHRRPAQRPAQPRDKIVWDVGHQCYAHKLLTGRRDRFSTIRQYGGLSGFPSRARVRARHRRHRSRVDLDQLRPRPRRGRPAGRRDRRQRRLRARRRGPHRRRRLRGDEPGRAPAHAAGRHPQRQRDVHPRQRRRPAALPQPHPSRPGAHAPARGHRARRRAHPGHRPAGLSPRQGRQGVHEGAARPGHALRGAGLRLHRRRRRARHARAAREHPPGHRHAPPGASCT